MNRSIIRFILGHIMIIEGILLLLPTITGMIYKEQEFKMYLLVAVLSFVIGRVIIIKKPESMVFYLKEGCVTTALSWILMSFIGCIPFVLTREIPSFTDALFETISGFTTTGASILSDVEALTHASLMWRSFTHWIGGMGVLVFLLTILSMTGGSSMNLMKAESPGPSVGKLVPKMRQTARFLYGIYFALTIAEFIALLIAGMPVFDSLNTAFATAGTGGFGIKGDSIASYNIEIKWIVTVFMILFGVNFNAYFFILTGKIKDFFKVEEVRYYLLIILVSIGIIFVNIEKMYTSAAEALVDSAFQVGSIITTTGFSTVDFNVWDTTAKTVLVLLMFCGACAGSTGGGIKVSRFLIALKTVKKELNSYIHPKSIKKIKMDQKPIEHEVVRSCNVYLITFFCIFIISLFIVSLDNYDMTTNFTAVAATINNIGPGLELVGPASNFGFFGTLSKYVLMFDMLAGRLELFPMLILFNPALWNDYRRSRKSQTQAKAGEAN